MIAAIAYANSFDGVLIGDDEAAIAQNTSIRSLSTAFSPPADTTVAARPIANLTFAINYALAGGTTNLWGYHAFNLAIHIATAIVLFGLIRRTLESPALRGRFGSAVHADGLRRFGHLGPASAEHPGRDVSRSTRRSADGLLLRHDHLLRRSCGRNAIPISRVDGRRDCRVRARHGDKRDDDRRADHGGAVDLDLLAGGKADWNGRAGC